MAAFIDLAAHLIEFPASNRVVITFLSNLVTGGVADLANEIFGNGTITIINGWGRNRDHRKDQNHKNSTFQFHGLFLLNGT
jgi:hypothetical protein